MSAAARAIGPACARLMSWLDSNATTQVDGSRVVWAGTTQIAGELDKTISTITHQLGQLEDAGLIARARRGLIRLPPPGDHRQTRAPAIVDGDPADAPVADAAAAEVIRTLAELAAEHPEHRAGLAAAVAIIANAATLVRDSFAQIANRPRAEPQFQTDSKNFPVYLTEPVAKSANGSRVARTDGDQTTTDEVRDIVQPLIEECRRCRLPHILDDVGVQALTHIPAAGLRHAVHQVALLAKAGKATSPLGLLVAKARANDADFFTPIDDAEHSSPPPAPIDTTAFDPLAQLDDHDRTRLAQRAAEHHSRRSAPSTTTRE